MWNVILLPEFRRLRALSSEAPASYNQGVYMHILNLIRAAKCDALLTQKEEGWDELF